jgi:hypothetical protein
MEGVMKKLRRLIATITLASTLLFGSGSLMRVRADDQTSGGPQGTKESKSGGPSASGTMTDAEWAYFLWLFLMWLCWGGL